MNQGAWKSQESSRAHTEAAERDRTVMPTTQANSKVQAEYDNFTKRKNKEVEGFSSDVSRETDLKVGPMYRLDDGFKCVVTQNDTQYRIEATFGIGFPHVAPTITVNDAEIDIVTTLGMKEAHHWSGMITMAWIIKEFFKNLKSLEDDDTAESTESCRDTKRHKGDARLPAEEPLYFSSSSKNEFKKLSMMHTLEGNRKIKTFHTDAVDSLQKYYQIKKHQSNKAAIDEFVRMSDNKMVRRTGFKLKLTPKQLLKWRTVRIRYMWYGIQACFTPDSIEGKLLVSTGAKKLILTEGSWFWSRTINKQTNEAGENWYGRMLMKRRKELQARIQSSKPKAHAKN